MLIVGLHLGHDASIALVHNGRLIATTSMERYSRVKKDQSIHLHQLKFVLNTYGFELEDVDEFTFSAFDNSLAPWITLYSPVEERYPLAFYGTWNRQSNVLNHLDGVDKVQKTEYGYTLPAIIHRTSKPYASADIDTHNFFRLNIRIQGSDKTFKGMFIDHHISHAASAFYTSSFDNAAIFTADASMHDTEASSGYFVGNGTSLQQFRNPGYMYGNFYDVATELLGIGPGVTKAGTLMGLSAYGRISKDAYDKWKEWTAPQYSRDNDKVEHRYIDWLFTQMSGRFPFVGESQRQAVLDGKPDSAYFTRTWQEPFTNEESTSQEAMDIAATIQFVAERSLVHYSQQLFDETKTLNGGNLCVSGGTFLNCNANYKIQTETDFDNMHMFPACGDDGTSVGSALWLAHNYYRFPRQKYTTADLAYTGIIWTDKHLEGGQPLDLDVIAEKLNEDKIVCWYDGRSENGPRALGHRSFITSPKNPKMKDILNSRVKFREWFRPFAPIVLKEKANDWFVMDFESPFMLHTVPCKKPFDIPSAVHIDNTARVQTLDKDHNPKLYDLIERFEKVSGIPVVINTSLNVKGQPIVETPNDAMKLFEESDVDVIVINDQMWFK